MHEWKHLLALVVLLLFLAAFMTAAILANTLPPGRASTRSLAVALFLLVMGVTGTFLAQYFGVI